jgi:hypothetical protein
MVHFAVLRRQARGSPANVTIWLYFGLHISILPAAIFKACNFPQHKGKPIRKKNKSIAVLRSSKQGALLSLFCFHAAYGGL